MKNTRTYKENRKTYNEFSSTFAWVKMNAPKKPLKVSEEVYNAHLEKMLKYNNKKDAAAIMNIFFVKR